MTTTASIYGGFSQNDGQHLDRGREALQENIVALLETEGAELDLVKQTHRLLVNYPELASLKLRIKYPEEIAKVSELSSLIMEIQLASKKTPRLSKELLALAAFYSDFKQKLIASSGDSRAVLLSSKVQVEGDLISPYRVTQDVALRLISRNKYGDVLKQNDNGNHPVVAVGGLHLKSAIEEEPLDTGMEVSVYLLHTLLFGEEIGPGLAPSSLLKLDNVEIEESTTPFTGRDKERFEEASVSNRRGSFFRRNPQTPLISKSHTYLVQASKTIQGKRLDEVIDDPIAWDEDNFSSLILASFLTIPSDNKPDNFIVTIDNNRAIGKIIGIDNDMAFAYPLTAYSQKKEHMIGFKNALLCFEKMMDKPIAQKVRDRIAKLDSILLGIEWAVAVMQQEKKFPLHTNPQAKLPLRFTKNTLCDVIENLQTLQKILSNPDFLHITHKQIFRQLYPVVERYYQHLSRNSNLVSVKVENLFHSSLPSVETYLNCREQLEDGRTIKEALASSDKRTFAYQEERDTPIEELCVDLLCKVDLSHLSPATQCALLSLVSLYFPDITKKNLHPSWKNEALPFVCIHERGFQQVYLFLQKLGLDFTKQTVDGDTILHLLMKQRQEIPKEFLQGNVLLETRNKKGLTPLDIAMELQFIPGVTSLINAGYGIDVHSSLAWEFYRDVVDKNNDPQLRFTFQKLVKRNQNISWKMAKEIIFPKQGSIPVISPLMGQRALHADAAKQLWNDDGKFRAVNTTGKRAVGKVSIDGYTLYLKQAPELPGVEQAVGTLMHQVMGFGAPHTDLVQIKGIPYLMSQEIPGRTLEDVIDKTPQILKQLDKKRLSQLLLMTMLINPEDGKPDNYIVELFPEGGNYQIVSIDNDHAFVPSVAKETWFGSKKDKVQVKTILYCLDQMNEPIDLRVKKQFLLHDPAVILIEWMTHISSVHDLYNAIYPESERKKLFNELGVFVGVPFRDEMISGLYRKMMKMQLILDEEKDNPRFSHMELLSRLDIPLGQRYRQGFTTGQKTPMQRFIAIDGKDYDIKDKTFVSTRQAKEILCSYDITTKVDIKSLIQNGTGLDAQSALKQLQEVVDIEQKSLIQRLLLVEGEKIDFSLLNDEQLSKMLDKINFSQLPAPVQQSIFNQIVKFAITSFRCTKATTLTNDYLRKMNFSKLKSLSLVNCQNITDRVVSQIVDQAPELLHLNLSENQSFEKITKRIIGLGSVIDLHKITHLILNRCKKIHTLMVTGHQLAVVECEGNSLTRLNIISKSLSSLNLKNNSELTDDALDDTIKHCSNLQQINLEGCFKIKENKLRMLLPNYTQNRLGRLSYLCSDLLSNSVPELTHTKLLKEKVFHNQYIDAEEAKIIARVLKFNNSLSLLRIFNATIGDEGAEAFAETLSTHPFIALTTLDLPNNQIGNIGAIALARALSIKTPLYRLDLRKNHIRNEGAQAIAESLLTNPSTNLTELHLAENAIEGKGLVALARLFVSKPEIFSHKFNLEKNHIGEAGVVAFTDFLLANPSHYFALLNLNNNRIGDKGAICIADLLKLKTIDNLSLAWNYLSFNGAISIAKVLEADGSLDKLDLSFCKIGYLGARAFAKALETNVGLSELALDNNQIIHEGELAIAKALRNNTTLKLLSLSDDPKFIGGFDDKAILTSKMKSAGFYMYKWGTFARKGIKILGSEFQESFVKPPLTPINVPRISTVVSSLPVQINYMSDSKLEMTPKAFYAQGKVLEKSDQKEAINCYLEAAEKNHDGAFNRLEELSQNSPHAQYALGLHYETKKELPKAAFYYAMATAGIHLQGKQALYRLAESNPDAQLQLAILLENGLGMKQNIEQAINLFQKAAEHQLGLAQLHLGILYHMGLSTEENIKLALSLITQAESQGITQAGRIKAQIQKEIQEKEKIIQRAENFDQALYILANKNIGTDLFKQLPQFNKEVFSRYQLKIKKAQIESLEREKTELFQCLSELDTKEKTASQIQQGLLRKQKDDLRRKLMSLEEKQKVAADPVEQARQFYLNQKRQLFYSGFNMKISTIFEAADAILSGNASRNTSLTEDTISSAIAQGVGAAFKLGANVVPFGGIIADVSVFAIQKFIKDKKDEQVKEQCSKIQGYYPMQGPAGLIKLSSLLTSSLVYRFQDHIPHLQGKSIQKLINYFVLNFTDYLVNNAPKEASVHELLLGSVLHKPTSSAIKNLFKNQCLQTDYQLEWPIDDLLFSTGVRTIYGGKYLPKDPQRLAFLKEVEKKAKEHQKEYSIYRWGTKEEIEKLESLGIEMECIEEERSGALATTIDPKKAAARYIQEAESLSQQFLE